MNGIETQGKYFKNLVHYIVPSVYALAGNSVVLLIVSIWISRWVGNDALGAINIVAPYLSFVYAYGLIFGVGGGTVASIYAAKGDNEKADRAFTLSLLLLIASMLVVAVVSYLNRNALIGLLGATDEIGGLAEEYLGYISVFSILFALAYAMNIHLRFDGYPFRACIGATLNMATTLLVSYICIRILNFGVAGAAFGLIASRVVIILYYMWHFISQHKGYRFRLPKAGMLGETKRIFLIGIPNALSEASTGIFILIFNYIAMYWLGNNGLIIFSVICYLFQLAVQFMLGVVQGAQPIISFHYAKGEHSLCYQYLRYALGLTAVLSICFTAAGYIFPGNIVGMYISNTDTRLFAQAVSALKVFSWFSLSAGINITFIAYFSLVDKANRAMVLSFGRGLVVICAAGLIMPYILGEVGIWVAPVVTELIILALALYYCKKDRILKELLPLKLKPLCSC